MINIKLTIEYDGTDFFGWQIQPDKRTVQEEIELALEEITNEKVRITAAGRTDTGVHARNQTANVTLNNNYEPETIKKALNGKLPKDIYIKNAYKVPQLFNSRFDALSKIYKYYVTKGRTSINRRFCWEMFYTLNSAPIIECCEKLIGKKDFRSFSKLDKEKINFTCDIKNAEWLEEPDKYIFTIEADRFLHKMVRTIVGTLIDVGRNKITPNDFLRIFKHKDRKYAGMTAPAKGLFLEKVIYPESLDL